MFLSLARNILITGVAYSVISVVGLLLAPYLIGAYGLAGYGQILLARLFLPSTSFAFLDFGIGETTTRAVATANHNEEWEEAARTLTLLAVIAMIAAAIMTILIVACAWRLPAWLSIAEDQRAGFTAVLLLTAALQPLLFLSLIAEGTLKGFERFKRVRSCEVASALTYGGLALWLVLDGKGPNWIAAALLVGLLVRFVMAAIGAIQLLRRKRVRARRWSPETRHEVVHWSRLMLANKMLGVIQTQVAQPLIGLLFGPAAVGAFDAVTRIPRFAKAVLSLLSATVLPLATRLKAGADAAALKRLGAYGIFGVLLVSVPPLVFAMAYSRPLLHYWIGDEVIGFWGWQSGMFLVTIINVALGFGGSILLADRATSTSLNRLTMLQVGLYLALSLALVGVLDQWAFALGQIVSTILVFPLQFALIRKALDIGRRLAVQFVVLGALTGFSVMVLRVTMPMPGLGLLIALGLAFSGSMVLLSARLLLARDDRALFSQLLRSLLGDRRGAGDMPNSGP